jgi:hypothetical protein
MSSSPELPMVALNALLPGSGLALRGRLATGLGLLVPALAALSVAVLTVALREWPGAILLSAVAGGCYLTLSILASALWWWYHRPLHRDMDKVHGLYRQAAGAYLRGELPAAVGAAERLAELLPDEAGSWRLLALVARAQGTDTLATNASQRAARLDNQNQ